MTSQILLDLLIHGFLPLERINLIIFDECHHGVGDHPMRLIMKRFEDCEEKNHPKVLGTSATLLNSNVKDGNVFNIVHELEITFHAKVITVESMAPVEGYGKPLESRVSYVPPEETPLIKKLIKIIDTALEVLNVVEIETLNIYSDSSRIFQPRTKSTKIKCVFGDIREHVTNQGLYVANKAILCHILQMEKIKKSMNDLQSITVMDYLVTQLVKMQKIVEVEMSIKTEYERIWKFSCDQVEKLFTIIHDYHKDETSKDNKFCCIVFVKRRFTAKVLYLVLQSLAAVDSRFNFLVPQYVVGNSVDPYNSPQEVMSLSTWSAQALVKFRTGEVNCLVATNVLDEGVDVPACSLVVHYDAPQDFRAYVQSKGRGRHKNSRYVIFTSSDDDTFVSRYEAFCRVEQSLQNRLIGNTKPRLEPLPAELLEHIYKYDIQPYIVTDSAGVQSVVTEVSAISLINRYCSTLGHSQHNNCAPTWKLRETVVKEGTTGFIVSLKLPKVSPLRQVINGDIMLTVVNAKRSAAVKACKKLHEIGELTDHLLPIKHRGHYQAQL